MESSFRGEELCGESHQAGDETVVVLSDWVPHRDTNSLTSPTASPEKKIGSPAAWAANVQTETVALVEKTYQRPVQHSVLH